MKKIGLILYLIINVLAFAEKEIPYEVEKAIRASIVNEFDGGTERHDYYNMQKEAYLEIEDRLESSELTNGEKNAVRKRLSAKHGVNYAVQIKSLEDEIVFVKAINKEYRDKQENNKINSESKVVLEQIVKDSDIPEKYMTHLQSEAERLYPDNYYEQKRFIESSIKTYKMFNK